MTGGLDCVRTEAGPWKDQKHECSAAQPQGREEGLEIELVIQHAYGDEAPLKPLNYRVLRTSGHVIHPCTGRLVHPNSTETEASVLSTLLDLTLCTSSPGCSFVSFTIFFTINW